MGNDGSVLLLGVSPGAMAEQPRQATASYLRRDPLRYFVDSGGVVQFGDIEARTVVVRTCCSHPSLSPAFASSSGVHKVPILDFGHSGGVAEGLVQAVPERAGHWR